MYRNLAHNFGIIDMWRHNEEREHRSVKIIGKAIIYFTQAHAMEYAAEFLNIYGIHTPFIKRVFVIALCPAYLHNNTLTLYHVGLHE